MLVNTFDWELMSATYSCVNKEETEDDTYGLRASWVYRSCDSEDEYIFTLVLLLDDDAFEVLKVVLECRGPDGAFLRRVGGELEGPDAHKVSIPYRLFAEFEPTHMSTHFDLTDDLALAQLFYREALKHRHYWQPSSGNLIPESLFEVFSLFLEHEERRVSEERDAWWAEYRKTIKVNGRFLE